MGTKLIAMILGVVLVLATATAYTQSVFAAGSANHFGNHANGGNGVIDGQTAHGLATACAANSNVADNNPNCLTTRPP